MKERVDHGRGGCAVGGWLVALVVAAWASAAQAQWTIPGDASIAGKLGVGTQNPQRGIHLRSHAGIFEIDRDADPAAFLMVRTAPGDFSTVHKAYLFGVKGPGVNNGEFTIRDLGATAGGSGGAKRLTIANDGRFAFGDLDAPLAGLHIRNPVAGDILRLDDVAGAQMMSIEADGDINARGAELELRNTSTTPGGYNLGLSSTLLANTGQDEDEAFLALNGTTAVIGSAGDFSEGLLQIVDEDDDSVYYRMGGNFLYLGSYGDYSIVATNHAESDDLQIATTGEGIKFIADSNNNTDQDYAFVWYNGGMANSNKRMELQAGGGNLLLDGTVFLNYAFDLAEAYWKSEEEIEVGDVVRIDPEQPNAVVLARTANERAVIGVISTDPGIAMGAGAFTAERLKELWGDEVAAQFESKRKELETRVSAESYLKGRIAKNAQMKSALAKKGDGKEKLRLAEEYAAEQKQLAGSVEGAALEAFCREHLALVALAGRVPVKVDASYGAIQVGDLLVASATPGRAMRSDNPMPGTVIGKALEAWDAGQGTIMMMVLNR